MFLKKKKVKGQTIEIDEDILMEKYKGNKRNYLYHEDPGYKKFVYECNRKRHIERYANDIEYRKRFNNYARINNKKNGFSISKEAYEKAKKYQENMRKADPEYFRFKRDLYRDPSFPRIRETMDKNITELSSLGPGLEFRELSKEEQY